MATLLLIQDIVWSGDKARGGQAMLTLQWLRGLERLGHRVILLNFFNWQPSYHGQAPKERFEATCKQWWHLENAALIDANTLRSVAGLDDAQLKQACDIADGLITVGSPYTETPAEFLRKVRPRIMVEQDPAYTHLWATTSDPRKIYGTQDVYFTCGANIGRDPLCKLPTHGIDWKPMWNPVVMDLWKGPWELKRNHFTTVAGWWDQGYLVYEGKTLGPKAEEFKRIIELPQRVQQPLGIVLDIEPTSPDLPLLRENGWKIEDPDVVKTPEDYRQFVGTSYGECTVTKGGYAGTHCGWFSDRSACYLAAGRPVVIQETGMSSVLPTGKGLLTFRNIDEAVVAIREVRADYAAHCAAARQIAAEHFNSDRILPPFLKQCGIA